jgi:hypothetical protein
MFLLLINCSSDKTIKDEIIKVRSFTFGKNKIDLLLFNHTTIKSKKKHIHIYSLINEKKHDTIEIHNEEMTYNNKKLLFIDKKITIYKNKSIFIFKFYRIIDEKYGIYSIEYINPELGLIYSENLNFSNVKEFNFSNFKSIHEQLSYKKLNFKLKYFEPIIKDYSVPERNY